jgi:hypothetical protein
MTRRHSLPGIVGGLLSGKQDSVGTIVKDALLIEGRLAPYVYDQRQVASGDVTADVSYPFWRSLPFDTDTPHQFLVSLIGPITLAIGVSPQDIVFYPPLAQGVGQAVSQDGLAHVGWATNQDGWEKFHRQTSVKGRQP